MELNMRRNPWLTLSVLAFAQFMVLLDVTIVNVALPSIQSGLDFSADGLQWVVSGYTLMFGGFLLLGGRLADLLGRRRMFVVGLALFSGASLVAGLSTSAAMLIAARAVQGLGGALLSPAALSLLTVTFPHGRERNVALGIWGALAGIGGTLGVVAGGLLVDAIGWQAVFFVNVPIGLALIALAPRLIDESRLEAGDRGGADLPGALLGTASLLLLVFGVVRAEPLGWGSVEVIGCLAAGVALGAAFFAVERRAKSPLVPMRIFQSRGLRVATGALALNGGAFLGMFFLTAIFLQQVRGASALTTGLQLLPMGVSAVIAAIVASRLVTRLGIRPIQVVGAVLSLIGLLLLSQVDASDSYVTGLLPGLLIFGAGLVAIGVPAQIAAVADFTVRDAGGASGVVTAGYQVGGALGLALINTLANSRVTGALGAGASQSEALVDGFHRGLLIAAAFAAVNVVIAVMTPPIAPTEEQLAEAVAA
jgi:EmrB/QacA subfamily drug resistance transporter